MIEQFFFDRTELVEGYYTILPARTEPWLRLSISAASPGRNINYREREKVGAEQTVTILLQAEPARHWLQRNTPHFFDIIIPHIPDSSVFILKNFR